MFHKSRAALCRLANPLSKYCIDETMLDPQKGTMGRVRQAYDLSNNEVEDVFRVLWPDNVFPVELWRRTHEEYWRAFADSNQAVYKLENPALPEIDISAKFFHPHLCALDVMTFFRKLSLNIQANTLRERLLFILEESCEDIDVVFPEESEFLFNTLVLLDKGKKTKKARPVTYTGGKQHWYQHSRSKNQNKCRPRQDKETTPTGQSRRG